MKKTIAAIFLLIMVISVGLFLKLRGDVEDAESRRKQDADAYRIRDELIIHIKTHDGAWPSSFSDLKFERSYVDFSSFQLFAPGIRKGQLGQDVIAEAEHGRELRIVIYADGMVRWE